MKRGNLVANTTADGMNFEVRIIFEGGRLRERIVEKLHVNHLGLLNFVGINFFRG